MARNGGMVVVVIDKFYRKDNKKGLWMCPSCKKYIIKCSFNYCPNCGARIVYKNDREVV